MGYKYPTPQLLLKAICNAIRSKTGNSDEIPHQNIPDELDGINMIKNECTNLIEIINGNAEMFSNYITTICAYRFYATNKLTTINLPECTSIGEYAFYGCTSLTTINLPKCTSIEGNAFKNCTNLTTANLPECTSIGEYAFLSCTNLTTVNLPKCTYLGSSAFGYCESLTTVNLPECTTIRESAFFGCRGLTTIALPECTSIKYQAFCGCYDLITAILSNNQVVTLGSNAFADTSIANGTGYVYVPDNLVDSYKAATKWSTYANQIKPISELPSNLKEEYGYD